VRSVAFRPDGRGMASGGNDRTWKSWNVSQLRSSGQVEHGFTCEGHTVRLRFLLSYGLS
jgi:WD40 repeat protein